MVDEHTYPERDSNLLPKYASVLKEWSPSKISDDD
jgi:hypothetical protein